MKTAAQALNYEDDGDREYDEAVAEAMKGTTVKKVLKQGKRTKREERKLGQCGVGYLAFYTLFWRVFVPHYAVIVTISFMAETTLVILHLAHK